MRIPRFVFLSVPLLLATVAPVAPAQAVAGSFAPNPAPIGVPITFTATESAGVGLNLPSPCGWYRIHQGSQTGPIVPLGLACIQVIVPVAANGTFAFTWDQRDASSVQVPPGQYWVEVRTWDQQFTTLHVNWFCIAIQNPGEPAITAAGPARLGLNTPLQIAAPSEPGATWIVACSLDSNTPLAVPGLGICLSDPLFFGPFTAPLGVLDAAGNSSGLELIVPSAPSVLWQGLHVQSLIFGAVPVMTNDLSFTIQP
jgi:hypothetical protein